MKTQLIETFKYQVHQKPDMSEMQATLEQLVVYIPELFSQDDFQVIMATYFMSASPLDWDEMSDLIYEFEKRVDISAHCLNLIDWLKDK